MKMVDCDCVILCGGLGTRLRDVIGEVPKVMAQVGGRPFLDLIIEYLKDQGAERIILCTGYKAEVVEEYYRGHDFGLTIDFSKEDEPLGTGGAIKNAREIILSDSFFVFNGDSFLPVDLRAFLDFHKKNEALASILVSQVGKISDFGSIEIDKAGRIISFQEKIEGADKKMVNAGIYCFDKSIFQHMPGDQKFMLENDLFPSLVGNQFYGHYVDEEFIDIGTPERYQSVRKNFKKGNSGEDRK